MRIRQYLLAVFTGLCLVYAVALVWVLKPSRPGVDRVAANDLKKTLEQGDIADARVKAEAYGLDYDIVDGTCVIYPDNREWLSQARAVCAGSMTVLLLLSVAAGGGILFYVERSVLKPFTRLEEFAGHVARGNLDFPLPMDKGHSFGAFTESFDLMRVELTSARERAKTADESKKQLVASLSHDIKTPLSTILATTELLAVKIQDQSVRDKLIIISRKAEQIQVLIDNLFHATLEELEELCVEPEATASPCLEEILREADYEHLLRRLEVKPCLIFCDPLRMQQVADNLISNSYKYAHTPIDVTSWIKDGFLYLRISDEGPGVTLKDRAVLKHRYYRGENSVGKSGSGIGLYISDYFMEKMGGMLEIEECGTGFGVILGIRLV